MLLGLCNVIIQLKYNRKKLKESVIKHLLADLARINVIDKTKCTVGAGRRHNKVATCSYTLGMVIISAPVGHNETAEAEIVTENAAHKVLALVSIATVNHIVAGHNGLGAALLDSHLKAGEIYLTHGALINHRIHRHAAKLLGVNRKMLWTCGRTHGLNSLYIGCRHFTRKIRVLGKILKVSTAKGASLYIEAGAENHMYVICSCLRTEGTAKLLAELCVPAVGHSSGGRKTGSRNRGVKTKVVALTCLLTKADRAVGKEYRRNSKALHITCGPGGLTLKQGRLFLKSQFRNNLTNIHALSPNRGCPK